MVTRAAGLLALVMTVLAGACLAAAPASAAQQWWINTDWGPSVWQPGGSGGFAVEPGNSGDVSMTSPPSLTVEFPAGITANGQNETGGGSVVCNGTGTSTVTCGYAFPFPAFIPGAYRATILTQFLIGVDIDESVPHGTHEVTATLSGGGADPLVRVTEITVGDETPEFGVIPGAFEAGAYDDQGVEYAQAGGHPHVARLRFKLNAGEFRIANNEGARSAGALRDTVVDLPAGFVGNPEAVPKCPDIGTLMSRLCPPETQVGAAFIDAVGATGTRGTGIFNMEPKRGLPAQFAFFSPGGTVLLNPVLRPDGSYAITVTTRNINETAPIRGMATVDLWGVPADPRHDSLRCAVPNHVAEACVGFAGNGFASDGTVPGWPADGMIARSSSQPLRAFLSNPGECSGQPVRTWLHLSSWDDSAPYTPAGVPDLSDPRWSSSVAEASPVESCHLMPFSPTFGMELHGDEPDAPSGLDVILSFDQDGLLHPEKIAPAHLKKAVVTLPDGVSVNPSGASGLAACSDADFGLIAAGPPVRFNSEDPYDGRGRECPDAATIGTAQATSPLLEEPVQGEIVLGTPKSTDPQSGQMFRMFLNLRNRERGLVVKVHGTAVADRQTGQLTATFDNNPQLPIGTVDLSFKGGARSILATPPECGDHTWSASFSPWSAEHGAGGAVAEQEGEFPIEGCTGRFEPTLTAGMSSAAAGASGDFTFSFSRPDGDQWLRGVTATLPRGMLANLRGVRPCTGPQAEANSCPAESQVGWADASAGAGSPFRLERPGRVFLTEGYRGGPFGLAVSIPVEAGPFRGDAALSPIVVRQAIHVDPRTAQVSVVSDPLPLIHHGIPLRTRQVTVTMDRDGFMRNPTDCRPQQVSAVLGSNRGASAELGTRFQVSGCSAVPFQPRVGMRILDRGRKSTVRSWNPRMRFVVRQGAGQAGIRGASVALPRSIILDQSNIRTICTRAQFAEDRCPRRAIYGTAKAWSPVLNRVLSGPVYLGSSPNPLPDLIVDLEGEVRIVLQGRIDSRRGQIRNTFTAIPDAPVSRFQLDMFGGRQRGLLVNSTDLCRSKARGVAQFRGQNGLVTRQRPRVILGYKGCGKVRKMQARRSAGSPGRDGLSRRG